MSLSTDANYLGCINLETVTILTKVNVFQNVAVTFMDGVATEVRAEWQPANADFGRRWTHWRKVDVSAIKGLCARRAAKSIMDVIGPQQREVEYRFVPRSRA